MIKKLSQVQLPHVFILLTTVIFICSLLSYIIPSGEFQKEKREIDGISKTLIIPGTFSQIERHYSIEGIFFNQEATTKSTPVSLLGFLLQYQEVWKQLRILSFSYLSLVVFLEFFSARVQL